MGPFASKISQNNRKKYIEIHITKKSDHFNVQCITPTAILNANNFRIVISKFPIFAQRNGEKTQTPITKLVSSWKQSIIAWCATAFFRHYRHRALIIAGILEKTFLNRSAVNNTYDMIQPNGQFLSVNCWRSFMVVFDLLFANDINHTTKCDDLLEARKTVCEEHGGKTKRRISNQSNKLCLWWIIFAHTISYATRYSD